MASLPRWPTPDAEPADARTGRARGAQVEALAQAYLAGLGLKPVDANANWRFGELDLVMADNGTLVFVEVRYRAASGFGTGAESITAGKRRKLVLAAQAFLGAHPRWASSPCRFDVVDASGDPARPTWRWIRDAFRADD